MAKKACDEMKAVSSRGGKAKGKSKAKKMRRKRVAK